MNLLPAARYQPHRFGTLEATIIRVLFAAVVWWSLPLASEVADLTSQKKPTGLATLIPLTWLAAPGVFLVCQLVLAAAIALYLANRCMALATGAMTLVHVLIFTLDNSQGATNHAYQLISLVLLAQFLTYLSPHLARLIGRWRNAAVPPLFGTDRGIRIGDLAVYFSQQTIAAAYVVAGLSKLIRSKGMWVWQSPNVSVELMKSNAQNFYNRLETDATYEHRTAGGPVDDRQPHAYPGADGRRTGSSSFLPFSPCAAASVPCSPGIAILALHYGIHISMNLFFKYNIAIVLIFFVNPAYWIGKTVSEARNRSTMMLGAHPLRARNQ